MHKFLKKLKLPVFVDILLSKIVSKFLVHIGERYEEGDCAQAPCAEWSQWQAWSTCSASCGQGTYLRERVCLGQHCEGFCFRYLLTFEMHSRINIISQK